MTTNFLVIGESCLDIFRYGQVTRLSPEAPIPILTNIQEVTSLGMAHNVYENLKSLTKNNSNYNTSVIVSESQSEKIRYVDEKSNHYFLRVDNEANYERIDLNPYKGLIGNSDFILISDYNKGFIAYEDICHINAMANSSAKIFLDSKKLITKELLDCVHYLKCNHSEYENNIPRDLYKKYSEKIIVTMGGSGAKHGDILYPTKKITTIDVSGAGDTFFASLAYKYAENYLLGDSIRFANEMASIVVQKKGVGII